MAVTLLKPTVIAAAGLGVLERELVVPRLVWVNPISDFAGALNDTVSIRVPAYATARTRALRSGAARTRDSLADRKIDVSLTTDVYKDIRITDEELTLDIVNFGQQVLNPVMSAIARSMEDAVVATIRNATYPAAMQLTYDYSDNANGGGFKNLAVAARRKLNDAQVPFDGRVLLVGSGIEASLLADPMLVRVNESGTSGALREASIGKLAGFDVITSPALGPDEGYAFHRSAFILSAAAPVVPAGAPFGASQSFGGFAMRVVRVLDSATIEDILAVDAWVGSSAVTDEGFIGADGRFEPSEQALGSTITLTTSAAADDIIDTTAAHGLVAGDTVTFPTLTGGTGLTAGAKYYVIAANLGAQTFQVSTTPGGSAVNFSADITAGTARKGGAPALVRAVKITAVA